jgi:hypothetical protein
MRALLSDADEVAGYVVDRERIPPEKLLPVGISLGTGLAASIAAHYKTQSLILNAPYSSILSVARSRPFFGWFTPLMWNDLDTTQYIGRLEDTCVIAAHGPHDQIISFDDSKVLEQAYRGSSRYKLLIAPEATHNNAFWLVQHDVERELRACGVDLAAAVEDDEA